MPVTPLNSRQVKQLRQQVIEQYGAFFEQPFTFFQSSKERIFLVNQEINTLNLEKLRIDRIGLYFGEMKPGFFRLSKEGAQLLVHHCGNKVKPIITLTEEETIAYFQGDNLEKECGDENKAIILAFGKRILGCAQYKEGTILNFLPKTYRGTAIV